MGLFRTGLGGAAYVHDFDQQAQRETQLYQLQRAKDIDARTQQKMLADDWDLQKLSNPYDQNLLNKYTEKRLEEFGKYTRSNPNWAMTPEGQMERVKAKRDLSNNEYVLRSERFKANYDMLLKAAEKDPDVSQTPEYAQMRQEAVNYQNTGSIDGVNGGGKEFVFRMPNTKDVVGDLVDLGKSLGKVEHYTEIGGLGASEISVPDQTIALTAINALNSPRGYRLMSTWKNLDPRAQEFYNNDPKQWVASLIKSGTSVELNPGKFALATGGNPNNPLANRATSSYYNDIMSKPANSVSYSAYTDAISPVKDGVYQVGNEGLRFALRDPDGKIKWTNVKSYNGQRFDNVITGKEVVKGPSGETFISLQLKDVPITDELVRGLPIINSTDYNQSGTDYGEMSVSPKYQSYVSIQKDNEGKPTGKVNMTAYVRAVEDMSTIDNYEKLARGVDFATKNYGAAQQLAIQNNLNMNLNKTIDQYPDGTEFQTSSGKVKVKTTIGGKVQLLDK